jgi:hypothetical protein
MQQIESTPEVKLLDVQHGPIKKFLVESEHCRTQSACVYLITFERRYFVMKTDIGLRAEELLTIDSLIAGERINPEVPSNKGVKLNSQKYCEEFSV